MKWCSAQHLKNIYKFGIELSKKVKDTVAIDKKSENMFWQDGIAKEMENMKVTFQNLPNGERASNGYPFINCHMAFDIKMQDFYTKVYLVEGGHENHIPDVITYSSVVTRETVCIALTMAALHDL